MCRLYLDHIGHLDAMIAALDDQAEVMMEPFRAAGPARRAGRGQPSS